MKTILQIATTLWLLCVWVVGGAYAQCVPITITADAPYTEDFESYMNVAGISVSLPGSQDLPACWSAIYTGTSTNYRPHLVTQNSSYHNNSTCVVMTSGNSSYGGTNYLIMPAITNNLATMRLTFDMETESDNYGRLAIGYMTDPTNVNTFVEIPSNIQNSLEPIRCAIDLSHVNTTGNVHIAFRWVHTTSYWWVAFDNIQLSLVPDCPAPTNLAVTPFESYTVGQNTKFRCYFSWQDASSTTSYEYTYVPAGTTPTWIGITTAVTSSTIGNEVAPLEPATSYDLYVRANNCTNTAGAPGIREVAGPLTITTPCLPLELPYTNDFTGMTYSTATSLNHSQFSEEYFPPCWTIPANQYSTYDCRAHIYANTTSNYDNVLVMTAGDPSTGCIAVLPAFVGNITDCQILFDACKNSNWAEDGTFSLGYYHNDTYTELQSIPEMTTAWVSYEFLIANLTQGSIPSGARLAFRFKHTLGTTAYYALVDHIIVRTAPDCAMATGLRAIDVTNSSATLTWSANGSTAWIVAYGVHGFNPDGPTTNAQTVTTNSLALNNLTPNTSYDFYVKPICPNNGVTYWSRVASFTTLCDVLNVPWMEDFNQASFPPLCWSNVHVEGSDNSLWQRETSLTYGGSAGSAKLPDMRAGTKTNLVTPLTYIPEANSYQVSFRIYRVYGTKQREGVKVWVNTAPDTIGATPLIHITRAYQYGDVVETAAGWYQYFATIPTSGNVYIIFEGISEYDDATYVDDIAVASQCYPPTNLAVGETTLATANVSWVPAGIETSWMLNWSTDAGVTDSVIVNNTPSYTINNLTHSTSYTVKVKSLCSPTDHSFYSRAVAFCTPCPAITLTENAPYENDFEEEIGDPYSTNSTMPICWAYTGTAKYTPGVYNGQTGFCVPISGRQSLALYAGGTGSIVILPSFTNPINTLQMAFLHMTESSSTAQTYDVGYITTPNDPSTFVALETLPPSINKEFRHKTILFPQYANIPDGARIAVRYYYNVTTNWIASIDSVVVSLAPACVTPGSLTISDITSSSATLSWVAPTSGVTTYQVHISGGTINHTIATSNQHCDFSNLLPNTAYTVKVRTICSEDTTEWSDPLPFTTDCGLFVVSTEFAFVETFDNITSGIPTCWNNSDGTTTDPSHRWNSYSEGYQGRGIRYNSVRAPSGSNNMLKSPIFDLTHIDGAELSFYWKYGTSSDVGDLSVYISTDGGTTYSTALAIGLKNSTTWTPKTIDLSNYCGVGFDSVVIVFKATSDYGDEYIYLDEVRVSALANCDAPTDLAMAEVTNHSAKVTWTTEVGRSYNLKYISETQDTTTISNVTSPYVCTGLQGSTTYTFMVQADCGGNDGLSLYSDPLTCRTLCDPLALPYFDNFNGYTGYTVGTSTYTANADLPDCWKYIYTGSSDNYRPKLYTGTYGVMSATDTCVMVGGSTSPSYGSGNLLILPLWRASIDSLYLDFDYTLSNTNSGDLQLGYLTDAANPATFTVLVTFPKVMYNQTPRYKHVELFIADHLAQPINYAILAFRFNNPTTSLGYAFIDNLKIEKVSGCRRPSRIQATNITHNSVTLTWEAGGNELSYWVSCYALGAGAIEEMTTTNTITLTGLQGSTTYEVEIMADCGNNGLSPLSNIFTFTTDCDPFIVTPQTPFYENFDNTTTGVPRCWDNSEGTTATISYRWNSYQTGYLLRGVRFNTYNSSLGSTSILKTAPLNLSMATNGASLSFWYKFPSNTNVGKMDVYICYGSDTVPLATNLRDITDWQQFTYDLSNFCGTGFEHVYILFKGTSDNGNFYMDMDEVKVTANGQCRTPQNVRLIHTSHNAITVGWDAVQGATGYNLQYSPRDLVPGTGTIINVTTNSYTFTNLSVDTTLYVYVQTDCGEEAGESEWTEYPLVARTTICTPLTITETSPYAEDFSGYNATNNVQYSANAEFPTCWYYIHNRVPSQYDYSPHIFNGTYAPTPNDNALILASNTSYGPVTFAMLPQFTNNLGDLVITFATAMSSSSYGCLEVGYVTNPYDPATYVPLVSIPTNYYSTIRKVAHEIYPRDYAQDIPAGAFFTFKWAPTQNGSSYVCIDDVVATIAPECLTPTNITATPAVHTAEITWTPRYRETAWTYQYGLAGYDTTLAAERVGSGTLNLTDLPLQLENLAPNTAYDFYLQSICTGGATAPVSHISFQTLCDAITLSETVAYTEDFEQTGVTAAGYGANAQLPTCWNYSGPTKYTPGVYNGNKAPLDGISLTLYCNNNAGTNKGPIVALPYFSNPLQTLRIQFDYRFESTSTTSQVFTLGYTTNADDPSNYVPLYTIPTGTNTRQSAEFFFNVENSIPTGARIAFKFVYNSSTTWNVCVDNIVVSVVPPCLEPNQVELLSLTAEEATFTWNARGSESAWEVACVPAGSEAPISGTIVNTDTTTLTQLMPQTTYDFYVRAICSEEEVSAWTSPHTFTTKCRPLTLPYYENFNSYYASTVTYSSVADTIARWQQPDCWDIIATANGSTNTTPHVYRGGYSSFDKALVLTVSPNSLAVLPEFNTLENVEVLFKTAMYSTSYGTLRLGYVVGSTFTTLATVPSNGYSSGWATHQYDLRSYTIPTGARLAFQFYHTTNVNSYCCVIDDLQIREVRSCVAPDDLTFVSSTETTAQFTWTPDSTEQNWVIEYGARGFIPGTGTTSPVSSTDATVTHTLTNLAHSTLYDAYIYAVCGAELMSYAAGPVAFETQCGYTTITETNIFTEDFNAYGFATSGYTPTPVRPLCWDYTYTGTGSNNYSPHIYKGTYNNNTSNGFIMACGGASYGNPSHIILPPFSNDLSDLQITFSVLMSNSSGLLKLGYVTYSGNTPTFVSLTPIPSTYYGGNAPAGFHTIDLSNYTDIPSGARIAFEWSATLSSVYYCVIDDIEVRLAPDCPTVNDIAVTSISSSAATLTWSHRGATAWIVEYHVNGASANVTPISQVVTEPTMTLTNLLPATSYSLTVTPICQGRVYPSSPFTFTTECLPLNFPYTEDFQSYTPISSLTVASPNPLPGCWDVIYTGSIMYAPRIYNGTSNINNSSSNHVFGVIVGSNAGNEAYAILPQVNEDLSNVRMEFDYRFQNTTYLEVYLGYVTNAYDATSFVALATIPPVSGSFAHANYALSSYNSIPAGARLALKVAIANEMEVSSRYSFGFDNVLLTASAPACLPPTDVAVSQIKHTSALVNWSNTDPSITGWVVRCTDGVSEQTLNTTDTFVRLQNLVPETAYTVTVKPLCGGYAPTSAPVQFVTDCAPILITRTNTYTEDFTSTPNLGEGIIAGVGSIPTCWESIYSGQDPNSAPRVVSAASTPTPNNNALLMEATSVTVLPLFANPMADLRVEFTTKMTVNANLQLGYVTNPADASTFTPLTTITPATTVEQHEERVYDYLATSQTIPAEARLAFATQTSAILYIDDVEVSLYQIYDTNAIYGCDSYTAEDGTVYTQTSVSVNTVTETDYLHHYVDLIQIDYSTQVTVDEDACGVYVWGDTTITTSGQYTRILQTAAGCDSLVTLNLTIRSTSSDTSVVVACDSYTWTEGDGRTYRSSRVVSHTLTDQYGCDSTLVLDLTINITEHTVDVQEACGSYTWVDGVTYTASTDTPTYTTTSSAGCDSIVTLNLTIHPEVQTDTNAAACGSFTWYGQTYTESGDYPVTLTSQYGCDSVVTLHLTIFEMPVVTITGDTEIAAGESTTLTATDNPAWNYVWSTGDRTSEITVSPAATTTYTLIVSNGPCVYNGAVTVSVSTGIHDFSTAVDRLFPMPADQYCIVEAENMKAINVYNANGQMVASYAVDRADRHRIATASYAQGVYFVKVITTDNRVLTAKMVVKH